MKRSLALYLISGETAPNFVIRNAFQNHFQLCFDFDWLNISSQIGLATMYQEFIEKLKTYRPEYCFMQIQNPEKMDVLTIREMAKYTKIINWTGDVRNSPGWYNWLEAIDREIYLTLFSNETDMEKLSQSGIRADYLQVGFDNIYYQRKSVINGWPDIVFLANNYDMFDLSGYRAETVLAMYEAFPTQFRVFGNGWDKLGISTERLDHNLEAECYNSCKLALSISNFHYQRYFSDRLLRIMGSGGCAISHSFPGLEKDFIPGHDIVTFSSHSDLIEKCKYYIHQDDERQSIANNALITAHTKCTWDIRCIELIELLNRYP